MPGDLDGDGFVGGTDLDIVRSFWGQSVTAGNRLKGDVSGDGVVGGDDLDEVRAHWGEGTPPDPSAVPEPSAVVLCLGLILLAIPPKTLLRFKKRIRELTKRNRGVSLEQMVAQLRRYLIGWRGYFGFCQTPSVLRGGRRITCRF